MPQNTFKIPGTKGVRVYVGNEKPGSHGWRLFETKVSIFRTKLNKKAGMWKMRTTALTLLTDYKDAGYNQEQYDTELWETELVVQVN